MQIQIDGKSSYSLMPDVCVSDQGPFLCSMQITDVFLNGHSNPQVQIIGLKMTTISKHLNVLEPQESALRYSPFNNLC